VLALQGGEARAWQSHCAMIFQQFNLVPRMDVASNVLHGILNRRSTVQTLFNLWPRADILKALDILDRLGIVEQAPKRAEALSGGQQQRVAIARALMQDPKIILADEPIASLDPMNAQVVMDTLKKIFRPASPARSTVPTIRSTRPPRRPRFPPTQPLTGPMPT
jgi:phosphonate transport system ATP-binding protein